MTESHLNDVVKAHMKGFIGFFLTFLGENFLKIYYRGVINHEKAIKLVYLEDNNLKGFVTGTMNPSGFYSALLKKYWFRFCIVLIPAILKKPKSFFRLLRALTKPKTSSQDPKIAELSSLVVLPSYQGKGIGKELVISFITEVKKRSGKIIYLTTDALNNDTVNSFYQKMGFKIKRVIKTPENRLMNEFWLEIK